MSYAQRPMGDYATYGYAGDPGWLSSIWKGVKKLAPRIIGGLIGGPVGAAIGTGLTVGTTAAAIAGARKPTAPPPPVPSVVLSPFPVAQPSAWPEFFLHTLRSVHTHRPGITSTRRRGRVGSVTAE